MAILETFSEDQFGKDWRHDGELIISPGKVVSIAEKKINVLLALRHKLETRKGEIVWHPDYGSDLWTLLGEPMTGETLSRAKLYFTEAILEDPRVDKVLDVDAEILNRERGIIRLTGKIRLIENWEELNLVYDFFLLNSDWYQPNKVV